MSDLTAKLLGGAVLCKLDATLTITAPSHAFFELLGMTQSQFSLLYGLNLLGLFGKQEVTSIVSKGQGLPIGGYFESKYNLLIEKKVMPEIWVGFYKIDSDTMSVHFVDINANIDKEASLFLDFRSVFNSFNSGMAVFELNGTIKTLFANRKFWELFGIPQDADLLYNFNMMEFLDEKYRLIFNKKITDCIKNKVIEDVTFDIKRENTTLWLEMTCVPVSYKGSAFPVIMTTLTDITAQHMRTLEKEAAAASTNKIMDNIACGLAIAEISDKLVTTFCNQYFYGALGISKENFDRLYRHDGAMIVDENYREEFTAKLRVAVAENRPFYFNFKLEAQERYLMLNMTILEKTEEKAVCCALLVDITKEKVLEQSLSRSETRFKLAFEQTSANIREYNIAKKELYLTDSYSKLLGLSSIISDVPSCFIKSGAIHPDSVKEYLAMYEGVRSGIPSNGCIVKFRIQDGEYKWTKFNYKTIFDQHNTPVSAIGITEDLSNYKDIEEKYTEERNYRRAILSVALASFDLDLTENRLLASDYQINGSSSKVNNLDALFAFYAEKRLDAQYVDGFKKIFNCKSLADQFASGTSEINFETLLIFSDKPSLWVNIVVNLFEHSINGNICGFLYVKDIDNKKRYELALKDNAERDPLTGLYNRTKLEEVVTNHLASADYGTLMMLDLDNYKAVNDNFGHSFGDKTLKQVAKILLSTLPDDTLISRIGGDEFVIFFDKNLSRENLTKLSETICSSLQLSFGGNDNLITISCSIGLASVSKQANSFFSLYKLADEAMYNAKKLGRNRFSFVGDDEAEVPSFDPLSIVDKAFFSDIDDIIYLVNISNYELYYLNSNAKKLYNCQDYKHKKCYEIIHKRTSPCTNCNNKNLITTRFIRKKWNDPSLAKSLLGRDILVNHRNKFFKLSIITDLDAVELKN